ncbi:THAP domain-containing protein 2-like isoform X2 [Camponotus floridanus]|uniref:THAP domain-containing protein 2-like isoform X2 n=1 Tax=Camponotus floridanus TaxID=104421 RepID=UPI000DC6BC38|nr:THAP domain-containing protein 2-like isoform X2 [Camponotus floridanus]
MPDCWAKGCKSRNNNSRKNKAQLQWEQSHNKKITFHKIPKNPEKRKKWLESMNLNIDIPENAKLCSLHFEESAFDRRDDYYIRIRPGVIPFVYKGNANLSNIEAPQKKNKLLNTTNQENIDTKTYEKILNAEQTIDIDQLRTPRKVKHQETIVSPRLLKNTPRKQILETALINVRKNFIKKIRSLQQKQRRSAKCIANLKNVLTSLKKKNFRDSQQLDILNNIDLFLSSNNTTKSSGIS